MTTARQKAHQSYVGKCLRSGDNMKQANRKWVATHGRSKKSGGSVSGGGVRRRGKRGKGIIGDLIGFRSKSLPF
jgi:hypothetical protein